jgi:hypothetical protein
MGLGVLNAYGVGPATVVDGGINALNAAGDAVSKAKKEVGSRLRRGVPTAVEAVGSVGNAAIQKTADAAKRLRNSVFGKVMVLLSVAKQKDGLCNATFTRHGGY